MLSTRAPSKTSISLHSRECRTTVSLNRYSVLLTSMEIEVKAKVADMNALRTKLQSLGCVFSEAITQDDTGYVRNVGSLETFLANDVFLRIRVQGDGQVIFTAKRPSKFAGDGLAKTEHEVTVSCATELAHILGLSGFVPSHHLVKTRQTAHFGRYEICLDEIESLGSFIEIEVMGEEADADAIQKDMYAFLESLGLSAVDQVKKGYDILLLEKEYSL